MQNYSWNPVLISLFFLNWYIDTYLGFFWICNRRSYSVPNSPLCWSSQIGLAQIVRAFLRNKFRLNLYWLWSAFQWWSYLFYSLLLLLFCPFRIIMALHNFWCSYLFSFFPCAGRWKRCMWKLSLLLKIRAGVTEKFGWWSWFAATVSQVFSVDDGLCQGCQQLILEVSFRATA